MSLNGANAVQSVLLQRMVNQKSENTNATESFGDVLSDVIESSNRSDVSQEVSVINQDVFSDMLDGDTSGALLASLLESVISSGSNMMLLSLGKALNNISKEGLTATNSSLLKETDAVSTMLSSSSTGKIPSSSSAAADPAVTSDIYDRDPGLYRAVIDQFSVETNKRYEVNKKGENDTYCNIFVWDVTSAMGAQIPHYYDSRTGESLTSSDKGAREMTANGIHNWLHEYGDEYGWYELSEQEAQELANQGRPVVTALYNGSGHGHVQVVCPSKDGEYDEKLGVTIAQAGRTLTSYGHITDIYNKSLPRVSYFAHM